MYNPYGLDPWSKLYRKEALREVSALRREKRLRDERKGSASHLVALARMLRLPLLGRAVAQRESGGVEG